MHNLHLAVVYAETGEDACSAVECELENFGNENNWRTICGAVSEDGKIYSTNDGRFQPSGEDSSDNIAGINKMVAGWVNSDVEYYSEKAERTATDGSDDQMDWYHLEKFARIKGELARLGKPIEEFNVLTDDLFQCHYDECGVTNMFYGEQPKDEKKWVVFIDMHS